MKYKVINKFITNKCNNNRIDITNKKIIFLGCGAVAKYLCRNNKDENIKVEKPKKVVQKKAKKSVEVVASTNS